MNLRVLYLRTLYAVRAWIDKRVPREYLMVSIYDGDRLLMEQPHVELMGRVKLSACDSYSFYFSPVESNAHIHFWIRQGYPIL